MLMPNIGRVGRPFLQMTAFPVVEHRKCTALYHMCAPQGCPRKLPLSVAGSVCHLADLSQRPVCRPFELLSDTWRRPTVAAGPEQTQRHLRAQACRPGEQHPLEGGVGSTHLICFYSGFTVFIPVSQSTCGRVWVAGPLELMLT